MVQLHQRKRSKKSKSDEWWTPLIIFLSLCKEYRLKPNLDVACTVKNCLCDNGLTDGLNNEWLLGKWAGKTTVWCNPPNSLLGAFLSKAYEQFIKYKIKIMMIVPANVMSSNAFWDAVETPRREGKKIMYEPIRKRIPFLDNGKKPKFSARNAYIIIIWGKKSRF